jgi:hypothetical protein
MSKVFQALLSGMFFTFILDFFLFLGIKMNYIDTLNIDLYYNILFADHQNIFLFLIFTIFLGYITLYLSHKISLIVLGSLFLLVFATLLQPIGYFMGEMLLMSKNTTLQTEKFSYTGDLYYAGRTKLYLHDYRLDKIIILDKNKIKEKN